mgnify:CR=1 FL=1
MKRKSLLLFAVLLCLAFWPTLAWAPATQQSYSLAILTGQDEQNIVGSAYASRLHKDVIEPFLAMQRAAAADGISISTVSAFRSYERQKEIFEGKFERFTGQGMDPEAAIDKIIEYSTIPGTSRHHWGTELDLIDAAVDQPESSLEPENYHGKGAYCKLKEWMDLHAESFGFYLVYTDNPLRKGFKYEPWHYSYAPVSIPMMKAYKEIDLQQFLSQGQLMGKEYIGQGFIERYRTEQVLDINPALVP